MQDSSTLKWLKTGFTACSTAFLATLIMGCNPPVEAPDADGDKIPDAIDNCRDEKNPAQTDSDKDGKGDFCEQGFQYDFDDDGYTDVAAPGVDRNEDNCPTIADPGVNDPNKCTDDDNDGIFNFDDICDDNPDTAADEEYCVNDNDEDGTFNFYDVCPDDARTGDDPGVCNDRDGDGVNDSFDNCPDDASSINQADFDEDGQGNICDADDDNDGRLDENDNADGSDGQECRLVPEASCNAPAVQPICIDGDNDGFFDSAINDPNDTCNVGDNCPLVANPEQNISACTDTDLDGIFDAVDNCIDRQNTGQNAAVCADPDEDGIFSSKADDEDDSASDNCPAVANGDQLDFDNDGAGDVCDADADNDGMTAAQEWPGCELNNTTDDKGWYTCGTDINKELNEAHAEWYAQILTHRTNNNSTTAAPDGTGNADFNCARPGGSGRVAWDINANRADQNFQNCRYKTELALGNSPGQGIAGIDMKVNGNLAITVQGTEGDVVPRGQNIDVVVYSGTPSFATINNGNEFNFTIVTDKRWYKPNLQKYMQVAHLMITTKLHTVLSCAIKP
jgi:hypothetical protein